MAAPEPGSKVAKDLGLALASIYGMIKSGKVVNHKKDGFPVGKGIEVDPDEVKAAMASKRTRAPKGESSGRKASKAATEAMHEALDDDEVARRQRRRASGDEGNTVRLKRYERGNFIPCPVFPTHGSMYKMEGKGKDRFHCPHQEHDGRTRNNPAGFAPATQNVFTQDDLDLARSEPQLGRLGAIMLEWIYAGRTDLATSLESWLEKNKLPVWVPER